MKKIRVLVVDDSSFLRRTIPQILSIDSEIEVIGIASDGREAIDMAITLRPDVITMDILMPVMDGISALRKIMKIRPVPVVMLSSATYDGAEKTIEALSIGAVDYIEKPSGPTSLDIRKIGKTIVEKIKIASRSKIDAVKRIKEASSYQAQIASKAKATAGCARSSLISIASSTGGPSALQVVLGTLPKNLSAGIVIVQHMTKGFTEALAERLNRISALDIRVAKDGDEVKPGTALIGPAGRHVKVGKISGKIRIHLLRTRDISPYTPSADVLFSSAAETFGSSACGVIMTGMGSDGAKGIGVIREKGGLTIAQDEATSLIFGMPGQAVRMGSIDIVAPLESIPFEIMKATGMEIHDG